MFRTTEEQLELGSGQWEFRLEIEGFPYQPVSHFNLALNSGSFERIPGLKRDGIVSRFQTRLSDRRLEMDGMSFSVVDLKWNSDGTEFWTEQFANTPSKYAELSASINSSQTTIFVRPGHNFVTNDTIHIGKEAMTITAITGSDNTEWTVTRGILNTIPHAVSIIDTGESFQVVPIKDRIITFDGRRVKLFVYAPDDDKSGPGTIRWRGTISNDWSRSDGVWSINAQGIADKFQQAIGQNLEKTKVRGWWHMPHYQPLRFSISNQNGTLKMGDESRTIGSLGTTFKSFSISGFFETTSDLVAAINDHVTVTSSLASWIAGNGPSVEALQADDGALAIRMRGISSTGTTNNLLLVSTLQFPNHIFKDGTTGEESLGSFFEKGESHDQTGVSWEFFQTAGSPIPNLWVYDETAGWFHNATAENGVFPLALNDQVEHRTLAPLPGAASQWLNVFDLPFTPYAVSVGDLDNRLYLENRTISDITTTDVRIEIEDPDTGEDVILTLSNPTFNNAEGYVTGEGWKYPDGSFFPRSILFTDQGPEIQLGLRLVEEGSFVDFLQRLVDLYPEDGHFILPDITTEDIDMEDIISVYSHSLNPAVDTQISKCQYSFYGGKTSVEDVIAEDLFFAGFVPAINPTNGKWTIRKLQYASLNQIPEAIITPKETLTQNGFPGWEKNKEHLFNIFNYKFGWDPIEEEYFDTPIQLKFAASIAEYKNKPLQIARKCTPTIPITRAEIRDFMVLPASVLAAPYIHVQIDCPFITEIRDLTIGSIVQIESNNLPDNLVGLIGVDKLVGVVMGVTQDWDVGIIELHVWASTNRLTGYTPTARINSGSIDGTTADLVFLDSDVEYTSDSTIPDWQWFGVGDRVRVETWNDWTPIWNEGEIIAESIGGSGVTYTVQFDSSPASLAPFTNDQRMRFPNYSGSLNATNAEEQKLWCYVSIAGQDIPISKFAI